MHENLLEGAALLSRSLVNSEIWFKPPEYIKIWIYLVLKANHRERRYQGYLCKRGQCFCTYKELLDQLNYKIGYRQKKYHESFMKHLMKYLRDTRMIDTMKEPRGVLITICNYGLYQDINNYRRTNERTNERTRSEPEANQEPLSINKNVKNDKNEKKILYNYDTNKFENISEHQLKRWEEAYPAIDINIKILQSGAWLDSHRKNRKKDFHKFINNWLKRAQENAPAIAQDKTSPKTAFERTKERLAKA